MINIFCATALSLLFALSHSTAVNEIPVTGRLSAFAIAEIRAKVAAAGGCNANVCFAIDGSGSISSDAFVSEKNFVLDVISVLQNNPVEVAAVQYATSVSTISSLTEDLGSFIRAVNAEDQLNGSSFVVGGINACIFSLFGRRGEALKIVLLGDAKSNIGSSSSERADFFRSIGGDVCAVGAGKPNDEELLAIVGGDPDKVFDVGDFSAVLDINLIIERLVLGICKP